MANTLNAGAMRFYHRLGAHISQTRSVVLVGRPLARLAGRR
jgi:hypothetical protein